VQTNNEKQTYQPPLVGGTFQACTEVQLQCC